MLEWGRPVPSVGDNRLAVFMSRQTHHCLSPAGGLLVGIGLGSGRRYGCREGSRYGKGRGDQPRPCRDARGEETSLGPQTLPPRAVGLFLLEGELDPPVVAQPGREPHLADRVDTQRRAVQPLSAGGIGREMVRFSPQTLPPGAVLAMLQGELQLPVIEPPGRNPHLGFARLGTRGGGGQSHTHTQDRQRQSRRGNHHEDRVTGAGDVPPSERPSRDRRSITAAGRP